MVLWGSVVSLLKDLFLVKDVRHGTTHLIFTWEDPRKDGCKSPIVEGVTLDYDMVAVHRWPDGEARPKPCVGQARENRSLYTVFKNSKERKAAGYQPVAGTPFLFGSWKDYAQLHLIPPDPEQTSQDEWYDYWTNSTRTRAFGASTAQEPLVPPSGSRDEIAAWVAKTHFFVDSGIREVWYLPREAPPDEIRLLEVSDRLAGPETKTEAIDFGLEVEGTHFRLLVADITSEQRDEIRQDPSRLPSGWSLDGSKIWRRGA